ncbi:MAG: CHAT domain-containing protein [Moorea sp. SIOASIH]|uniref:SAV_2336 N-terminal domain-related protein n=1 Tax=Moorena sp. SIOASIH TaxID=2607817 RepID=UPI0013B6C0DC|nr:CHAT domain-containing tetratricopeptide repeat protein [Moorena sp. SIOASIH]NEO37146.1 CHAT domain-containing protein [Moorena sp. SIOASIH]
MVGKAIAILQQAGFDLTAREIAEILWLAVHLDQPIDQSEEPQQPLPQQPSQSSTVSQNQSQQPQQPSQSSTVSQDQSQQPPNQTPDIQADTQESSFPEVTEPGADVYPPSSKPKKTKESREAIPIKVPAAVALRNSLALGRALRPLMRKVPSAIETILDQEATVYQIAESNIWLPVLKPTPERWLELALVVEKTSSTAVWKQTIIELQHLVKHHGAFRDVRTWELTITETEDINKPKVDLFPQTSTGGYHSTAYSPQVLIDPKKQRLILLVSDCISVAWRRQLIHPVLELWGRNDLLTILQLLPERLWERTALASETPVQLHSLSPGVVNSQFIVKPWDEDDIGLLSEVGNSSQNKSSSVSVPVVTLEPYPLLAWSQVIAGQGNVSTVGFNFDVSQDPQVEIRPVDGEATQPQLTAPALVSRFRATASPMARRLAGLMAAAPVSLPVVQLIQQTLLRKSAQIHVAEVFMSGLLQSITPVGQDSNPDYIEYEFKPGVRELLVDGVPISKTVSVIDQVSEFVAKQLGLSIKEFEGRLLTPATTSNDWLEEKIRPFAQIKAEVLGRLGGEYARLAEQLLISQTPTSDYPSSQDYLQFLMEVFQATVDSNSDPTIVYPLLETNLDKLDDNLIYILQTWASAELSEVEPEIAEDIANTISEFSNLISDFPLGNKASKIEIAMAGYEQLLTVFTRESNRESWATIQNNLGIAYSNRIHSDRALNLEKAIQAYQLSLSVYNKQDFPQDWAMTQNNLGIAYSNRIRDNRAENLERAIQAYQLALSVYNKQDFPQDWAMTQNNLGIAYSNRIRDNRAENLERAIQAYQLALSVYTRSYLPIDWAMTQANLGIAYSNRISGDRALNLEKAIEAYQLALSVYTKPDFPYEWATTQNNLGAAYCDRIRADRALNLEKAIEAYQRTLSVYTKPDFPIEWARTQANLGIAYSKRIRGDRASNLEKAIEAYQRTLSVYTKSDFPIEWAQTQNNLGAAYSERIRADRAENIERAIEAFQLALSVQTKSDFPIDWAQTQNNLGTAYCDRIFSDRASNLENAIEAFQLALCVYTKPDFPIDWAMTQNNLGNAYCDRIRSDRAENIERAIAQYKLALEVYTKPDFPIEWAQTQNNLGNAYRDRIRADRSENLERAIQAFQLALSVRTKSDFPIDWAMTQHNLGTAYSDRIRGDRAYNLENAIEAFQRALEVYTPEADPINCLTTSSNLGNLYFTQGNWQATIDAYQHAITAVEISRSWASTDQRRQEIMAQRTPFYHKMVQAYINIGQSDKAIETVERSKARNLVELLTNRDLYPKGNVPQEIITELDRLRRNIPSLERQLEVVIEKLSKNSDDKQPQQRPSLEESRKQLEQELQQSQQQLDLVLDRIKPIDPSFSLTQNVKTIPFREIQSLIDQRSAIIEWYVTGDKILTFIVTSHSQQPIVVSSFPEDLERLENWDKDYTNAYREQKNQWITNLSSRLANLATILDIDNIISEIDGIFEKQGVKCDRLILVPHRLLHLFPLHALPLSKGNLLIDRFERGVSYAPSSQLLKLIKEQHRPNFNNLFAIQNPTRAGAKPLPGSKLEVDKIRQYFDPNHSIVLAEAEATEAKLNQHMKQLRSAHCVHFSCHGKLEFKSPLESALLLADADLTLSKIFKLNLSQCRIVVLSASESGMTLSSNKEEDIGLPSGLDEYIGLPSGFLYAGSPSVISTLWTVDPLANALLVIKLYKNLKRLPTLGDGDVSTALVNAQLWLRTLNSKTLARIQKSQKFKGLMAKIFENNKRDSYIFYDLLYAAIKRQPYPFAHPYYWAASVVTGT